MSDQTAFVRDLDSVLFGMRELLIAKNKAYGDSALNPVRILSKAHPRDLILARIDDKLKRLALGEAAGEDVYRDLCGYFILLAIFDLRTADGTHQLDPRFLFDGRPIEGEGL